MIQNTEIRFKNGMDKISAYYKAKAALGMLQSTRLTLESTIAEKRIVLNTLMSRNRNIVFDIDTTYEIKDFSATVFDSSGSIGTRSDIKAIEKDLQVTSLQQIAERAKLKPEFGIEYNHMFGLGGLPMQFSLLGTMKLPMVKWSAKATKASIESLKWKAEAYKQQKEMLINDASGMAYGINNEIGLKKQQLQLFEDNIIPALKKNYQSMQLGYEQNTEQLFTLYDAWETLNMTQIDYLDQLQQLLLMQVELERILEVK